MALEVGNRVGDYEVLALLGAGGMGRVYKVRNIISNREEAMKVLLPDFTSEPELAARFMVEIRTLAGLEHPNIAQLRTAFQLQNQLVMVMEYVEGTTLETLASRTQIPVDRVIDYSTQVLAALSYAHGKDVTHRDIKPANIMITAHGVVKLMDFGIAKSKNDMQLTRPGTTMGSVYYMSPEQVRGGTVDARSDIYSYGVTLYEMLTGRKPFQAETSYSVLNAQLNEAPMPPVQVNPALAPALNNIVLRALVKDPDGRFQTADEFRNALKSLHEPRAAQAAQPVAAAAPAPAPAPSAPTPGFAPVPAVAASSAQATGKSNRGLWIGLGAAAAVLAIIAAITVLPRIYSTHAGQKQQAPAADAQQAPATTPDASGAAQPTTPAGDAAQPNPLSTATPAGDNAAPTPAGQTASANPTEQPTGKKSRKTAVLSASASAGSSQSSESNPPAPSGPSPQEVREAHDRYSNLDSRADAARTGVQQIRSAQQAQGLDIRTDILSSMNRMNSALREADGAIGRGDLQAAKEYMDKADREIATLEAFLGH